LPAKQNAKSLSWPGRAAAISEQAVTDAAQIVGKRRWPWIGVILDNIAKSGRNPTRVVAGYLAAWILFFLVLWVIPTPEGLSPQGMAVMAIVVWASLMWISEAMPVGITGISIPLLLIVTQAIPWVKTGNTLTPPLATVFAGFTTDVIWLCLFAFMVGGMMQLMKLDRRIAMVILLRIRASPVGNVIWGMYGVNIVLSFLVPAANARAAAMLPVVNGIANLLGDTPRERDAQKAIVIQSLVYGSMIGGMFIMTAHLPNLILVNLFASSGHGISFLHWMWLNWPYLGMLPITYLWVRSFFRIGDLQIAGGFERIRKMHAELGPMSQGERMLLAVFGFVALLFLLSKGSPIYELHSYALGIIGLIGIMILFTPGFFSLTWRQIEANTIWGTFLLLGGALTLTGAMASTGLATWLAHHVHAAVTGLHWWFAMLIVIIGTHVIRLGMLSNVAAVALLAPITYKLAESIDLNPVAFALLVCNSDSFAYVLPTQITAAVIAYSSNKFSTVDYAKVGVGSTLIGITYTLVVMVPWYAFVGLPVWDPAAPWPF
jgi:solute carrier family 13 (sodium-dependent dicarboxylate transporter), member 2/3/5